jgi:Ca2+-binding EF-hand superfamily protein
MKTLLEKIKSFFSFLDFNNDGKVSAEDAEIAKALAEKKFKEANELLNDAKAEVAVVTQKIKRATKKKAK